MAPNETETQHKLGHHEATIQSIQYRLDDLKDMLIRFQAEHREEQSQIREELTRVETKMDERLRPLERFKTGCYWLGSAVTATGGTLAAYFKNGSA